MISWGCFLVLRFSGTMVREYRFEIAEITGPVAGLIEIHFHNGDGTPFPCLNNNLASPIKHAGDHLPPLHVAVAAADQMARLSHAHASVVRGS